MCLLFVLFQCGDFCSPAWRFVPREWLAAKGLFLHQARLTAAAWEISPREQDQATVLLYTPLLYCPLAVRSAHVISCCLAQAKRKQQREAMLLK